MLFRGFGRTPGSSAVVGDNANHVAAAAATAVAVVLVLLVVFTVVPATVIVVVLAIILIMTNVLHLFHIHVLEQVFETQAVTLPEAPERRIAAGSLITSVDY